MDNVDEKVYVAKEEVVAKLATEEKKEVDSAWQQTLKIADRNQRLKNKNLDMIKNNQEKIAALKSNYDLEASKLKSNFDKQFEKNSLSYKKAVEKLEKEHKNKFNTYIKN